MEEETNNVEIIIEEENDDLEDVTILMECKKKKGIGKLHRFGSILKLFLLDQTRIQDTNVRDVDLSTWLQVIMELET